MNTPELLNPGQAIMCRRCLFFLQEMFHAGHPTCCSLVRWQGPRHVRPDLVRDAAGERCNGFAPAEPAAAIDARQAAGV